MNTYVTIFIIVIIIAVVVGIVLSIIGGLTNYKSIYGWNPGLKDNTSDASYPYMAKIQTNN
jgi:hypothetical protein